MWAVLAEIGRYMPHCFRWWTHYIQVHRIIMMIVVILSTAFIAVHLNNVTVGMTSWYPFNDRYSTHVAFGIIVFIMTFLLMMAGGQSAHFLGKKEKVDKPKMFRVLIMIHRMVGYFIILLAKICCLIGFSLAEDGKNFVPTLIYIVVMEFVYCMTALMLAFLNNKMQSCHDFSLKAPQN